MRQSKLLLIPLFVLILASCSKPDKGSGKAAVNELYPHRDYLSTIYTESMIRSAANLAGLDSSFAISSRTDYIFQFEVERNSRIFLESTDSVLQNAIDASGMDKLVDVQMPGKRYSGYVKTVEGHVVDAIYFEQDSDKVKLMEFVGNMPIDVLFKEGMKSYVEFGDILNLDILNDERNDTTDQ